MSAGLTAPSTLQVTRQRVPEELGELPVGPTVDAGAVQQVDAAHVSVLAAIEDVGDIGVDQEGGAEDARAVGDERPLPLLRRTGLGDGIGLGVDAREARVVWTSRGQALIVDSLGATVVAHA